MRVQNAWLTDENGRRIFSDAKTLKVRDVRIPCEIMREISNCCHGKGLRDFVVTGAQGHPLNDGYMRKTVWLPVVRATYLSGVRFHDLRYTAPSILNRIGTPIVVVSQILGHSSTKMTLDVCGHYYEEDAARWMQSLEDEILLQNKLGTEQEWNNPSLRAIS